MSEEKNETKENINGDNKFVFYFLTAFVCSIYSFIHMSIETNGDLGRYYRPFEDFFINFFVAMVIGFIVAAPIHLISKWEFSKTLFWSTLILMTMSLLGQSSSI